MVFSNMCRCCPWRSSAASSNLILVTAQVRITEPGAKLRFGRAGGIAPAQVPGDRVVLVGVGAVVGAV
jgi:hypothetical protein